MNRSIRLRGLALLLFLLAPCLFPLRAQEMITCFSNLPDSMLPLVNAQVRGTLLLSSARPAMTQNALGGIVKLDTITNDYLRLEPTKNSRFELLLLPAATNGEKILAVIETVAAPAEDSKLSFFTTEWQPLPSTQYFTAPTDKDFLTDGTPENEETTRWFHPVIIGYRYDAPTGHLIADCRPELYMPKEQYEKLQNALRRQPIIYRWDNGHFVKE